MPCPPAGFWSWAPFYSLFVSSLRMGFDRVKGLLIVFGFIFLLAIGFSLLGYNWFTHVDQNGTIKDSPFFYVVLLVAIAFIAFFLKSKSQAEQGGKISVPSFVNVAISGVAVGGIIHEIVHILLLSHPTQLRLHFGDPYAIFSTCCLLPGELANEEIAYAVQFLVTIAWVIYFENLYYNPDEKYSTKKNNPTSSAKNAVNEEKSSARSTIKSGSILSKNRTKESSREIDVDELQEEEDSESLDRNHDAHVSDGELHSFLGELEKTKVKKKK